MSATESSRMEALETLLRQASDTANPELADWLAQSLPGGKRLRPNLLFLCAGFAPNEPGETLRAAAAIELVHLASLVHDDILDGSPIRRGRPSLFRLANPGGAVMAGDFLFASAFQLLAGVRLEVLAAVTEAIRLMCEGEIEEQQGRRWNQEQYYSCINKKTASLLAAACKSGGLLCGLPSHLVDYLSVFGLSLGTAYQILDDILDLTGDGDRMGKPVRWDLANGVLTLPVIAFLERSSKAGHWEADLRYGTLPPERTRELVSILLQEGYVEWAAGIAARELELGRTALQALPPTPARQQLDGLAAGLPDILNSYASH